MDRDFFCLHSEICKTLANPRRQMILAALRSDESSVGDLVARTGIPQSSLSQHLSLMRTHGIVRARRDGTRVFYSLTSPKIAQAFDLITEVMEEVLETRSATLDEHESGPARGAAVHTPPENEGVTR